MVIEAAQWQTVISYQFWRNILLDNKSVSGNVDHYTKGLSRDCKSMSSLALFTLFLSVTCWKCNIDYNSQRGLICSWGSGGSGSGI